MSEYDDRRQEAILFRIGGSSAKSAAAWLSAIGKAEAANDPCPSWDDLEKIASSMPEETYE